MVRILLTAADGCTRLTTLGKGAVVVVPCVLATPAVVAPADGSMGGGGSSVWLSGCLDSLSSRRNHWALAKCAVQVSVGWWNAGVADTRSRVLENPGEDAPAKQPPHHTEVCIHGFPCMPSVKRESCMRVHANLLRTRTF